MKILGIGVDLVKTSRIEEITRRWAKSFLNRIFTENEQEICLEMSRPSVHFSGRFAIKEAFLKALGTGLRHGFRWREIETLRGESGQPEVRLYGRVQEHADSLGVRDIFSSISHDHDYAIAQIVLQGSKRP